MSLLTDLRFVLKKYLKNPVLVAAGAYIMYQFIKQHTKTESLAESIQFIERTDEYVIFFDEPTQKFILIDKLNGFRVYSANKIEDLNKITKNL